MALITCYECGAHISELATSCPLCGAPAVVPAIAAVQSGSVHAPEEETRKSWGWLRWTAYLLTLFIVFKLFGVLLSCVLFAAIAIWNNTDANKPVPRILATIGVLFIGLLLWFGVRYWANSPTISPTAAAQKNTTNAQFTEQCPVGYYLAKSGCRALCAFGTWDSQDKRCKIEQDGRRWEVVTDKVVLQSADGTCPNGYALNPDFPPGYCALTPANH